MNSVTRIEIIVTSQVAAKITNILDRDEAPGYTLIRNAIGKGDFGLVSDDLNLGSSKLANSLIICYCSPDLVQSIVTDIEPIIDRYGGVCYLSEAKKIGSN